MSNLKFDSVRTALNWLESKEPAEIVKILEDYPGVRGLARDCPLARFCKETTGTEVSVGLHTIMRISGWSLFFRTYHLEEKLRSVRSKFDVGDYPNLVLES